MDKLLTVTQAAIRLGITEGRVRQLIEDETISAEHVGTNGRFIRIRESVLKQVQIARAIPESLPV